MIKNAEKEKMKHNFSRFIARGIILGIIVTIIITLFNRIMWFLSLIPISVFKQSIFEDVRKTSYGYLQGTTDVFMVLMIIVIVWLYAHYSYFFEKIYEKYLKEKNKRRNY